MFNLGIFTSLWTKNVVGNMMFLIMCKVLRKSVRGKKVGQVVLVTLRDRNISSTTFGIS